MKPGYKTTEFWLSLAGSVFAAVKTAGLGTAAGPALTIGASLTTLLPIIFYAVSRGMAKSADAATQS